MYNKANPLQLVHKFASSPTWVRLRQQMQLCTMVKAADTRLHTSTRQERVRFNCAASCMPAVPELLHMSVIRHSTDVTYHWGLGCNSLDSLLSRGTCLHHSLHHTSHMTLCSKPCDTPVPLQICHDRQPPSTLICTLVPQTDLTWSLMQSAHQVLGRSAMCHQQP